MESFPAIVATENPPASLQQVPESSLPEGDVTVDVSWSSLNYKDGLAVTGKGRIVRSFPMVCGIDLAGTVRSSDSDQWSPGDEVVVTGWGLSETHPGGYTTRQRVRSEWLQPRPEHLSLRETMAIGTGGLTAMLCILALEDAGLEPGTDGEVLVTGAGGGVGSFAVMLLASSGLPGGGGDRSSRDCRLPHHARCHIDRRARRALCELGPAVGEGTLERGHRHRGESDVGDGVGPDPLPWRSGGMRLGRRFGPAHDGAPVHPAQRQVAWASTRCPRPAPSVPRRGLASTPMCRVICSMW